MSKRSTESNECVKRVSTRAASHLLGVSIWTVRRMIRNGELTALRVGGRWQILADGIDAFLDPARNAA